MSFFESNGNSTSANSSETCENCSSSFTIFKRKKTCHICRQQFCQSCVNRQQLVIGNACSSSSERICVICQSIFLPQTTADDLMKYKLKHLRSILNAANVATNTCKEKRDLAELVLRNNARINLVQNNSNTNQNNTRSQSQPQQNSATRNNPQSASNNSQTNNPFSQFMNNVQDFVNFNINSVNGLSNMQMPSHPMPPPNSSTTQQPQSNQSNNRNNTSRSSSSSSNNSAGFQQQSNTSRNNNNNNSNNNNTFTQTSTSTSSSHPPNESNLNSIFNLISEQVPNVFNQTFTNNQFTFNNLFNGDDTNSNSNNNNNNTSSTRHTDSSQSHDMNSSNTGRTENSSNEQQSATARSNNNMEQTTASGATNIRRRASISDIKDESDIDSLTIKQIKEILACNFVDYKGCCEKKELVDKAKRLYASHIENKRLENEIENAQEDKSNITSQEENATASGGGEAKIKKFDDADLCKICMESLIDCVLLDCGHMVSCIKCGKRLAECPMCRQNIVRVIRVFKS